MKKLLALTLILASFGFVGVSSVEASAIKANVASTVTSEPLITTVTAPQVYRQRYPQRRYNRRARVTTQSRLVRRGRRVYRETYQVRVFRNGRTQSTLISRVRVR